MKSFVFVFLMIVVGGLEAGAGEPVEDEIKQLKKRVEALESNLDAARREIAELKKELAAVRSADRAAPTAKSVRDQAAKDLERLQGDWTIIFVIEREGKERETSGSGAFSIKGDQIQQWNEGFAVGVSGKITLDPSKKPAHIDITNEGKKYLGIYEFSDRGPILMLSNEGGERPTRFQPRAYKVGADPGKLILKKK